VKMTKKIFIGIGVGVVLCLCLFLFWPTEKPFNETAFKDLVVKTARQRAETDFVPDIIIDDFPASAWLFAQKYGYKATDIPLEWDFMLEIAEGKKEGVMTIYSNGKLYELPFPDRLVSRTHYSFTRYVPWKFLFL